MEVIIASLGIAICGAIMGYTLGFREGLAKGQQIMREVHKL